MSATIRVRAVVQPGGRLEVFAPDLPVGQTVDVTIAVPETAATAPPQMGIYDFIKSLPPSTRTPEEWEAYDREFRESRDSWERPWYNDPPSETK